MSNFSVYSKYIPFFYLFACILFLARVIYEIVNGGDYGVFLILTIAAFVMFYIKRRMYLKHYKK
jgi:hypothetical protein